MKILHTGDIHLDSPFSTRTVESGEAAKRELRGVFANIIDYIQREGVDMLLVSGDLFDSGFATRETAALIYDGFEKAGCPVVIAPGNHDPYTENSIWKKKEFSSNVHIFSSDKLSHFDFEELGVRVYGYAFTEAAMKSCPFAGERVEEKGYVNILCAHGDTASPFSVYCPITTADITAFGADYTALGHIHSPEAANAVFEEKNIPALYCGCPQGRDFGECGEKGAVLVEFTNEGGKVKVEKSFVPFAKRVYEDIELDVTGAETVNDIISEVRYTVGNYGNNTSLRITLTGNIGQGVTLVCDDVAERCREGVAFLAIEDKTAPLLSVDELKMDMGIRGEVYRVLAQKIDEGTPEEKAEAVNALKYALAALSGESIG